MLLNKTKLDDQDVNPAGRNFTTTVLNAHLRTNVIIDYN